MAIERRTATRRFVAFAFASTLALSTPAATAQPPPTQQGGGVDYAAVMRQGSDLYEQGNKLGAIQIWERLLAALGEERGWKVLYNLGLAYESVGDPTRAVERLDAFVKRSARGEGKDLEERRQDAAERLRVIRSTHAEVRVSPSSDGRVVLVRVGSAEARPAGFVVFLAPGEHEMELHAGTANARRVKVHAVAGGSSEVAVTATDAPPTTKPRPIADPPPPERPRGRFPTVWLVSGAALTVASGALPLVLGLRTSNKRDEAEAIGPSRSGYASARSDFEDARQIYSLSYIVPAALAVATAIVVVLNLPSKSTTAASSPWSGVVTF